MDYAVRFRCRYKNYGILVHWSQSQICCRVHCHGCHLWSAVRRYFLAFKLKGIRAGVGINSLGADLKGGKVAGFPSSGKLTIGYDDTIVSGKLALGAYLDSDYFFNNSSSAAAGLNIVALDMISLRAGYRYSSVKAPLASYASTGIGLKLWGVSLDASYIFGSRTLKNSFSISLGYSF